MEFMNYFKIEKELKDIKEKIKELKSQTVSSKEKNSLKKDIEKLEKDFEDKLSKALKKITPYEIVKISRHPNRPYTLDYINSLIEDFVELHGDRNFGDDKALITGLGAFQNIPVCVIGHQKGRNTKDNVYRNFAMPRPEGYRKALRVMKLAERFKIPILTFIDTPGAYPGIDAEERGQSEAIANNILSMCELTVPVISCVIGEGGSGGALAIAVANRVLMLEYATYSVISPEGCASILWKDASHADKAAKELGLTANVAYKNKIIDDVIKEPLGGAHFDHELTMKNVKASLLKHLKDLMAKDGSRLKEDRIKKYFHISAIKDAPMESTLSHANVPEEYKKTWHDLEKEYSEKLYSK